MAVIVLTAAASPTIVGANGVVGDAASTPTSANTLAGVAAGSNSNGVNSAAYTYANGAGAGDTIASAELLKGVATNSRLYSFLSTSFVDQASLDKEIAALGIIVSSNGGTAFRFITAAPGVPTATMNGTVATGALRISLAASISA
jgi:hypothetical protein